MTQKMFHAFCPFLTEFWLKKKQKTKKNNVYTKQVTWTLILLCEYPQGQSKF